MNIFVVYYFLIMHKYRINNENISTRIRSNHAHAPKIDPDSDEGFPRDPDSGENALFATAAGVRRAKTERAQSRSRCFKNNRMHAPCC